MSGKESSRPCLSQGAYPTRRRFRSPKTAVSSSGSSQAWPSSCTCLQAPAASGGKSASLSATASWGRCCCGNPTRQGDLRGHRGGRWMDQPMESLDVAQSKTHISSRSGKALIPSASSATTFFCVPLLQGSDPQSPPRPRGWNRRCGAFAARGWVDRSVHNPGGPFRGDQRDSGRQPQSRDGGDRTVFALSCRLHGGRCLHLGSPDRKGASHLVATPLLDRLLVCLTGFFPAGAFGRRFCGCAHRVDRGRAITAAAR